MTISETTRERLAIPSIKLKKNGGKLFCTFLPIFSPYLLYIFYIY